MPYFARTWPRLVSFVSIGLLALTLNFFATPGRAQPAATAAEQHFEQAESREDRQQRKLDKERRRADKAERRRLKGEGGGRGSGEGEGRGAGGDRPGTVPPDHQDGEIAFAYDVLPKALDGRPAPTAPASAGTGLR